MNHVLRTWFIYFSCYQSSTTSVVSCLRRKLPMQYAMNHGRLAISATTYFNSADTNMAEIFALNRFVGNAARSAIGEGIPYLPLP